MVLHAYHSVPSDARGFIGCAATVISWRRTAAALLRRRVAGTGVARCGRPGEFDERHGPPAGAVELAHDEALLLDIGQETLGTAQRARAIGAGDRRIARARP